MKYHTIITAGSTYLDIDAYACAVAMAELMRLQGENVVAYSRAPCNYSVCEFLIEKGQMARQLPEGVSEKDAKYIIVDVSDPEFLKDSVPLDKVSAVYDHHVGFEEYWESRIGDAAKIEFVGAAATLIYREWKQACLQDKMSHSTALLLIAAILDNTLNLTSSNTTDEDREAFFSLCRHADADDTFRALYFSKVQENVEADLENALRSDMKQIGQNPILPPTMMQLCVWDADGMFGRLAEIRKWFGDIDGMWMLNLIDIKHHCGYFVCDDKQRQTALEKAFGIRFEAGIAKLKKPYLRKQIIKRGLDLTR